MIGQKTIRVRRHWAVVVMVHARPHTAAMAAQQAAASTQTEWRKCGWLEKVSVSRPAIDENLPAIWDTYTSIRLSVLGRWMQTWMQKNQIHNCKCQHSSRSQNDLPGIRVPCRDQEATRIVPGRPKCWGGRIIIAPRDVSRALEIKHTYLWHYNAKQSSWSRIGTLKSLPVEFWIQGKHQRDIGDYR